MGGKWGTTRFGGIQFIPEFTYLRGLSVNWVGVSLAIHVPDSADSTVTRIFEGDANKITPSFSDEELIRLIRALKSHGFHVYLTLAFEPMQGQPHPVNRGTLGDPNAPAQHKEIDPANWPWSLNHPQHGSFVAQFWASYTAQAVAIGRLAEAEGVELYSLGTETDLLFRSRWAACGQTTTEISSGPWSRRFGMCTAAF